jgi:hypothetical protein
MLSRRLAGAWRSLCWVAGWCPLSWLGVVAATALPLVFHHYGVGRQDRILLALSAFGLGLLAVSVVLVVLAALGLRLKRQKSLPVLELEAGVPTRTGIGLALLRWVPWLRVEVEWVQPPGVDVRLVPAGGRLIEEVTARRRGVYGGIVRRFRVTDVLGLARFSLKRRAGGAVIRPACGAVGRRDLVEQDIPSDQLSDPAGTPDGDRIEMRPYVPGDPLKLILWKLYGRTGRLLVRLPERATAPCEKTLAYLVAADDDEPAAGVARAALENGSLGYDYLFGADGAEAPTPDGRAAVELVVRSAAARGQGGAGLQHFLGQGEKLGIRACVLFVPARPGDWLLRVAAALARHNGPCRVVVGTDGVCGRGGRWWRRWLFRPEPAVGSREADVRAVCDRLTAAGAAVCVIDRTTGQQHLTAAGPGSQPRFEKETTHVR